MTVEIITDSVQNQAVTLLPLDKELLQFSIKATGFFTVLWMILFFGSKVLLPIPQSWNIKKPFD